jgi:hypothetical protein
MNAKLLITKWEQLKQETRTKLNDVCLMTEEDVTAGTVFAAAELLIAEFIKDLKTIKMIKR